MILTNSPDLPVLPTDFPLIGFLKYFDEPSCTRGLEIGANENYCSAILQRNGFHMTGIDPNPYKPERLLLDKINAPYVIDWRQIVGTVKDAGSLVEYPYDFIVSISAIEHFGLGFYGEEIDEHADQEAMKCAYAWLKPGGRFYLTVPTGTWSVTNHWRRYDSDHLGQLLQGLFRIRSMHVLHSHDLPALQSPDVDKDSVHAAMTWNGTGCNYEPLFILEKPL